MYEPISIRLCELHLFVILQVVIPKALPHLLDLPSSPLLGWFDGQALLRKNQALLSRRIYRYY